MAYYKATAGCWISLAVLPVSGLFQEWGKFSLRGRSFPLRSTEFLFELPTSFLYLHSYPFLAILNSILLLLSYTYQFVFTRLFLFFRFNYL